MILESYKHFNAEEYIKSLRGIKQKRELLMQELDSLLELPAIDNNSGIKSTSVSDMTGNQAIRRVEITAELDEIDLCLSAYDYAKSRLSPDDREVIELFFEPTKPIWQEIEEYTSTHYICRVNLYKRRREALDKMAAIITEKYL